MIESIAFQNYKSFNDLQILDLSPPGAGGVSVIYGQNASGKTNIFKALQYLQLAVTADDTIDNRLFDSHLSQPFLLNETSSAGSIQFEVCLRLEGVRYRYGFQADCGRQAITKEWLYKRVKRRINYSEVNIFTRESGEFTVSSEYRKFLKNIKDKVPDNILALVIFSKFNFKEARLVIDALVNKTTLLVASSHLGTSRFRVNYDKYENPEILKRVKEIIEKIDIYISIQTIEMVGTGEVVSDCQFDLQKQESQGTRNLIAFLPILLDAMDNGKLLVLDEFGSSLHPFVTAFLVKMLKKKSHNGQFILLTHETYLLKQDVGLDRNQIWLVNKNNKEESELICFDQFKIRKDARLDKQYLEGRFGGVPRIFED